MNAGPTAKAVCMSGTGLTDRRRLGLLIILAVPVSLILLLLSGIPVV